MNTTEFFQLPDSFLAHVNSNIYLEKRATLPIGLSHYFHWKPLSDNVLTRY